MFKQLINNGFSVLEIIIVIVLLTSVAGFSALYYQTSQVRNDLNTQATEFASYLRLAASNANSGLNGGESSGVHLESDSYTLFSGDIFDPLETSNFTIDLPPTISIENINLNGGGQNIIFTAPKGETLNYGTLDFNSDQIQKTVTITISQIGVINY